MIVLILGKPGSGKGTQAKKLASHFGMYYFSTGDFSRKLAKKDPRIDEIINKEGKLIPEKEMTKLVLDFLEKKVVETRNIIFDGFPRFVNQYRFLEKWLAGKKLRIDKVFVLEICDKEAVRRLSSRRIDKSTGKIYNLITNPPAKSVIKSNLFQREDDTAEVIDKRLKEYNKNTDPMISYIGKKGILIKVNGERPISEIQEELTEILNKS